MPHDPAIPLLGIYQKELKTGSQRHICTPTLTAGAFFTIAKRLKQPTCTSTSQWIERVPYTYNGVLFHLKEEGNPALGYNMNEPWGHYAT